jgi:cyclopropane fatty-acyl-phospholipid synthase-like methyltransferase
MIGFSPAAERNKKFICDQLSILIKGSARLLEIGSASGQHALYCSHALPDVSWQCSDRADYLPSLVDNIKRSQLKNVLVPIELDVMYYTWNLLQYDVIFTANTLHIMTQKEVDIFLRHVHLALRPEGKLIIYGPFNYKNGYTSESNHQFDNILRHRQMGSYIKSFESVDALLIDSHFKFVKDINMPANNQLIVWQLASDVQ